MIYAIVYILCIRALVLWLLMSIRPSIHSSIHRLVKVHPSISSRIVSSYGVVWSSVALISPISPIYIMNRTLTGEKGGKQV